MASQTMTSAQTSYESSLSFQSACEQSPLCICDEGGYLRSRYRTVTKTFLWKPRLIVLLTSTGSTSLMLFQSRESDYPSLTLRLNENFRIETVQDHPTHLSIILAAESTDSFFGSDQPKIRNDERFWRLKLPSREQAMFWKSILESAALTRATEQWESDTTIEERGRDRPTNAPTHITASRVRELLSIAASRMIFVVPWLIPIFAYLYFFRDRNIETIPAHPIILQEDQLILAMNQQTEGAMSLKTKNIKGVMRLLRPRTKVQYPQVVNTHFQHALALYRGCFAPDGLFAPGSLVFEYFWLCIPASIVLSVSMLSITSRVLNIRWILATLLALCSVVLGTDAYTNYWRHPLSFGLYWNGYGQSLIAFCFLGTSLAQAKRALGRRPRQVVSNRRKVASALSAGLASLAFPLSLRAADESNGVACCLVASVAFVLFFAGLHFFGWARRDLIVGGYPVGETVYQFSLLPARVASAALYAVGDVSEKFVSYVSFCLGKTWTLVELLCSYVAFGLARATGWLRRWLGFCMSSCLRAYQALANQIFDAFNFFHDHCAQRILKPMFKGVFRFLCAAFDGIVQIFSVNWRCFKRLGEIAREKAISAASFITGCLESVATSLGHCIMHVADLVSRRVLCPAVKLLTKFIDTVVVTASRAALALGKRLYSLLINCGRSLASEVFLPFLNCVRTAGKAAGHAIQAMLLGICRCVEAFGTFLCQSLLLPTFRFLLDVSSKCASQVLRWATKTARFVKLAVVAPVTRAVSRTANFLSSAIVVFASPILKKYWQWIPAGLALNGSYLYTRAAISEAAMLARIKFGLGAWALFLVGCTIAQSVTASQNSALLRQHVIVIQSPLQYIDFYAVYAARRVISSGWHALSVSFDLVLTTCNFAIRKACSLVWWLSLSLHDTIVKPAISGIRVAASVIWNSPYFSMIGSLLALTAAYLLHSRQLELSLPVVAPDPKYFFPTVGACSKLGLHVLRRFSASVRAMSAWGLWLITDVYGPVVGANASSSGAAFSCWTFTSVMCKTRSRFRIKSFSVPILIVYATGVAAASLVKATCVSSLVWIALSLFVDQYEEQSRTQTMIAFDAFRSSRRRRSNKTRDSTSNRLKKRSYQQCECVICLEEFGADGTSRTQVLPCGHRFHEECVQEWLHASDNQRCPICRRATDGMDRVLEIVF